jgi:predicted sugar kinase
MKFEASHYDTVEWNPEPLEPGKIFYRPKKLGKVKIGDKKEVIFRAPCRIDIGLLDYSALKFTDENDYKAGEMSFACDAYTWVKVKLIKSPEFKIKSARPRFIEHYASIVKQATDYKGGFEIETIAHPYRHVGFGSSAIMAETTAYAINYLLGSPLSFSELRKLIAYNFVEESDKDKDKLFPGASTGGSFNTIKSGGFVITSAECEQIFHEPIPKDAYFIIGTPNVKVAGPEASETDVNVMGWERHNERVNAAKSCLWILMEIMPYWIKGDYKKAGEAFYNYTLFGGKAMQMLFYRCDAAGILFELKEAGIEGGWMTSAGPSLVAFTLDSKKKEKAMSIFERRGCKEIVVVRPDNAGIVEVNSMKKIPM